VDVLHILRVYSRFDKCASRKIILFS
jgi:hypothetical protein